MLCGGLPIVSCGGYSRLLPYLQDSSLEVELDVVDVPAVQGGLETIKAPGKDGAVDDGPVLIEIHLRGDEGEPQ